MRKSLFALSLLVAFAASSCHLLRPLVQSSFSSFSSSSQSSAAYSISYPSKVDLGAPVTIEFDALGQMSDESASVAFADSSRVKPFKDAADHYSFYAIMTGTIDFTVLFGEERIEGSIEVVDSDSGLYLTVSKTNIVAGDPIMMDLIDASGNEIPIEDCSLVLLSGPSEPHPDLYGRYTVDVAGTYSFVLCHDEKPSNPVTVVASEKEGVVLLDFAAVLDSGETTTGCSLFVGESVSFALSYHEGGEPYEGEWSVVLNFNDGEYFQSADGHSFIAQNVGGPVKFSPEIRIDPGYEGPEIIANPSYFLFSVHDSGPSEPYSISVSSPRIDGQDIFGAAPGTEADLDLLVTPDVPSPIGEPGVLALGENSAELSYSLRKEEGGNGYYVILAAEEPGSYEFAIHWGNALSDLYYLHTYDPNEELFSISADKNELHMGESAELSYSIDGFDDGYMVSFEIESGPVGGNVDGNLFTPGGEGTYFLVGRIGSSDVVSLPITIDVLGEVDPYEGMSEDEFYASYEPAASAYDAEMRTLHNFMSGSLEVPDDVPVTSPDAPKSGSSFVKNVAVDFVEGGAGYRVHDANGEVAFTVYEGGAYITLEEVAAYIQAFGDVPANYCEDRYDYPSPSSSPWGEYLRLNNSYFSGDTDRYPYEPLLPDISGEGGSTDYYEVDIGTTGTVTGPSYPVYIYNDGSKITRGGARIVYAREKDGLPIEAEDRHLFYTYNHYNDFQEYLNYENGWGERFGNVTAGGEIDEAAPGGPTPYVDVVLAELF